MNSYIQKLETFIFRALLKRRIKSPDNWTYYPKPERSEGKEEIIPFREETRK